MIPSRKEIEEWQKQKYVNVKLDGIKIKLQLDTCSDISIFDVETDWKPSVEKKKQSGSRVSGKKLNFKGEFMSHISFLGKTSKSKLYVLQNTSNRLDYII